MKRTGLPYLFSRSYHEAIGLLSLLKLRAVHFQHLMVIFQEATVLTTDSGAHQGLAMHFLHQ